MGSRAMVMKLWECDPINFLIDGGVRGDSRFMTIKSRPGGFSLTWCNSWWDGGSGFWRFKLEHPFFTIGGRLKHLKMIRNGRKNFAFNLYKKGCYMLINTNLGQVASHLWLGTIGINIRLKSYFYILASDNMAVASKTWSQRSFNFILCIIV